MPARKDFEPGEFCWVDYTAHDLGSAVEFYGSLFGWKSMTQETPPGAPAYAFFLFRDAGIGGIGQMSDEMKGAGIPPTWNSYVCVEDCAASEAKARELGASIHAPTMDVPGYGKLCFFADPGGATVAMWQSTSDDGPGLLVGEPGGLSWNELMCKDVAKSREFYGAMFGWEFVDMPMGEITYTMIKNNGKDAGGMMQMDGPQFEGVPPHWMVYFAVENCADTTAKVEGLGGSVLMPPTKIGVGIFSMIKDAQGGAVSLIELHATDC